MEKMKYAEELVREFLVFRGFTNTLQAFEKELATDIGKGFQVDKILDLIFSVYIPKFEADKLVDLLSFFRNCFSFSDSNLIPVISKLDQSILRYYIVNALKCGRKDKVLEFFGAFGNDLLRRDDSWSSWFAIPYLQNAHLDPQFRVYFSEEWFRALHLSVMNFLTYSRTPALLKISSERDTVKHLKKEINQLNLKLSQVQTLLQEKEALLRLSRSGAEEAITSPSNVTPPGERESFQIRDNVVESCESRFKFNNHADESGNSNSPQGFIDDSLLGSGSDLQSEENFLEVKAVFQDSFLGHTSPISCSRFSASGDNIASSSIDGTVRIWTYDSAAPTSRNATIYCGAEIMSLEWDCKSDRLLLIGTSDGGIKAWNVDAKRVVCDLNSTEGYPSILDLKCSPVEPIFVSAAASRREGTGYFDKLGFASLTVWNMRTWKPMLIGKTYLFCNPENSSDWKHEMALDADGRRLLVTSSSTSAPIYQVRGQMSGMRTLSHSGSITTVDWHPTLPIFLTGVCWVWMGVEGVVLEKTMSCTDIAVVPCWGSGGSAMWWNGFVVVESCGVYGLLGNRLRERLLQRNFSKNSDFLFIQIDHLLYNSEGSVAFKTL
ncbi:UNVERIFIED_CONTAM: WD repeat-containing protein 91 [Sesamum radiatum]|uniref:WD repeat-containing protein 91 n=1 Tax=Sesamum radiatum TaxID=300843 RepID=A0AAW2KDK6_SESRA